MSKTKVYLAVLDLPEEEQERWVFENVSSYQNLCGEKSLADLAFRLRDEVIVNQGYIAWHKAEVIMCEYMGKAIHWFTQYGQPHHWIITALIAKQKEKADARR